MIRATSYQTITANLHTFGQMFSLAAWTGDVAIDMAMIAHTHLSMGAVAVRFNLTRGGYLMVTRSTIFLTRKDLAAVDAIDLPTNVNVQAIRRCR